MADYYPTLARAVASLPQNTAQARQDLYARARTIVADQLRGRGLRRGASEAVSENAALETAIRKIEAESRPAKARTNGEPRRPAPRVAADQERADNTARSLSKILQAVQPGEVSDASAAPQVHERSTNACTADITDNRESAAKRTNRRNLAKRQTRLAHCCSPPPISWRRWHSPASPTSAASCGCTRVLSAIRYCWPSWR